MIQPVLLLTLVTLGAPTEEFRALIDGAAADRTAGYFAAALQKLERAYRLNPSAPLLNNIGLVLQELGRYRDASDTYFAVLKDPSAPEALKKLDQERLDALEPKLDRAWIALAGGVQSVTARACGQLLSMDQETGAPAGVCILEVHAERSHTVSLSPLGLEAGRRITPALRVEPPVDRSDYGALWLDLDQATSAVVDGYALTSPLPAGRVWLNLLPGRHVVGLGTGPVRFFEAEVVAGSAVAARAILATASPEIVASQPAPAVAPSPSPLPWIFGGLGVVLGGVSAAIFTVAAGQHDAVLTAQTDSDGAITSISQKEAFDREQSARGLDTLALSMAVGAGVCLVGATVLAILDD